jgi:hypothetical protein
MATAEHVVMTGSPGDGRSVKSKAITLDKALIPRANLKNSSTSSIDL